MDLPEIYQKVCNLKDNVFVLKGKAEQDNDDFNDIVKTVTKNNNINQVRNEKTISIKFKPLLKPPKSVSLRRYSPCYSPPKTRLNKKKIANNLSKFAVLAFSPSSSQAISSPSTSPGLVAFPSESTKSLPPGATTKPTVLTSLLPVITNSLVANNSPSVSITEASSS